MYTAKKEITFCYGHRLLRYSGKCKNLHGHNAKAEIELQRETLDHRDMVIDFDDIKNEVKSWIDTQLDHRMLLCKDDPFVPLLQEKGELCYILDTNPTAEAIARLIYDYAASKGFPVSEVRVWETETSMASYRR
ncbi:MAG: 6-carboxytetrahydropterin synthase [Acidobacteria bacterium]|nr:6-carboxytetrahydropterin synthase [Acidobacteriota bacterium]